jgi:DNA-binding transcriptional regulator YbjK
VGTDVGTDVGVTAPSADRSPDELVASAAAEIVAEDGFAAVTHSAVAARVGPALAATAYCFGSRSQLLEASARVFGEPYLDHARTVAAGVPTQPALPAQLAATVVAMVAGAERDLPRLLTFYERHAEAGRTPGLRTVAAAWTAELVRLVEEVLRRGGYPSTVAVARVVVAAVDGLLQARLVEGFDEVVPAVERDVADLLGRLRTGA